MAKLTNWTLNFSITYDPQKRREALRTIWKFMNESNYGDSLDLPADYRLIGYVYDRPGFDDGDEIITSEVRSIGHTHHKDTEEVSQFTFYTRNTPYDVSLDGMRADIASEAKSISFF